MGTGILATLLALHAAGHPALTAPAAAALGLAWTLLLGLGLGFGLRVVRNPAAFTSTLREPAVAPMWGTVAMGVLSVGSATLTVTTQLAGTTPHTAVVVAAALWCAGTVLGLATTGAFLHAALTRDLGRPTPVWGLPVVPPMVSATTGAALVSHLPGTAARALLLLVCAACFVVSLAVGGAVFAVAYHHHARRSPIPLAASASAWIPLGVVGQSMAAAQALAAQSDGVLGRDVEPLAHAYGAVMLVVAVPVVAFAVRVTARGFRAGMPFGPGWWSLTFPLGTLALGGHLLGASSGWAVASVVGALALAALVGTWTLCAAATLWAVRTP